MPRSGFSAHPLLLSADNWTDNVWGGRWIPRAKGLRSPAARRIGESWEFSAHPHRPSRVLVGAKWVPLDRLLARHPALLGRGLKRAPLLLKWIDAREALSVQVHPDDAFAARHENDSGKTESWLILSADRTPGRGVIHVGFRRGTRLGFAAAIARANALGPSRSPRVAARAQRWVEPFLNKIRVREGEVYHLPAGTVHAIGAGVRICEIQQTSDVTYRVWDWNRPDPAALRAGRLAFRPLHVEKALRVMDVRARPASFYRRRPAVVSTGRGWRESRLVRDVAAGYAAHRLSLSAGAEQPRRLRGTFEVLSVLKGRVRLACACGVLDLSAGAAPVVPATATDYTVTAKGLTEMLIAKPA